jgi:uncharacterized membrane protein YbhN (UPF0104 family)
VKSFVAGLCAALFALCLVILLFGLGWAESVSGLYQSPAAWVLTAIAAISASYIAWYLKHKPVEKPE